MSFFLELIKEKRNSEKKIYGQMSMVSMQISILTTTSLKKWRTLKKADTAKCDLQLKRSEKKRMNPLHNVFFVWN